MLIKHSLQLDQKLNSLTHCSDLFKMTDVAAHQEGCRSHEKVQHSSSQDRNIWLLPGQRLKETAEEQRTDGKMKDISSK